MAGLSAAAKDTNVSWVETHDGKMECRKVNMGISKARIVLNNGEKKTIQIDDINSYAMYGRVFTKLPLYRDNKPTDQMIFMELVRTRGNLNLYRVENFNSESIELNDKVSSYFVYDGNRMLLALDEKSLPNISKIFGIRYSYM